MLKGIRVKAFRFFCPYFADIFVRGKALEPFESFGEAVGQKEVLRVDFQLIVRGVIIPFYRGFSDRSVHAFDLAVGPRDA